MSAEAGRTLEIFRASDFLFDFALIAPCDHAIRGSIHRTLCPRTISKCSSIRRGS